MKKYLTLICLILIAGSAFAATDEIPDSKAITQANTIFVKGLKATQQNNFDQAEKLFLQALELNPLFPNAYFELGRIQMIRKQSQQAVEYFLKSRDAFIRIQSLKANAQIKQQNDDLDYVEAGQQAELTWGSGGCGWPTRGVERTKENRIVSGRKVGQDQPAEGMPAVFHLYLGCAYMQLNKADLAEKEFLEGIRKDERLAILHYNLAVVYLAQGRCQDSAREARLARDRGFKLPEAFVKDLETRGKLKL